MAGVALSGTTFGRLSTDFEGSGRLESHQVQARLDELDPNGGEIVAIVDGAPVDDAAVRADVEAVTAELRGLPFVRSVLDHYSTGAEALVATDRQASLVVVELVDGLDEAAELEASEGVAERLRRIDAPSVEVGGEVLIGEEFKTASEKDLRRGETIALPIAMVALVVIFGGLLAAGLPLVISFVAVGGAMLVLLAATGLTSVSVYATNVVFMLGIGLGIDYGLLLVSRFREERAAGLDVAAAVERTVATAGMTVFFSALTVAVALGGLFAFDDPAFVAFGIAGVGVVLLAMAAGITLLPALLGLWGHRIKPAKASVADHGYFHRLAGLVQRRAGVVVAVVGVGLAVLAVPFAGVRLEEGDARSLPRSSESRAVAMTLADRFPGRGADPLLVVADTDATGRPLAAFVGALTAEPGVAAVSTLRCTERARSAPVARSSRNRLMTSRP